MLVLSRKTGERIQIGATMEITVLAIRKGRVKLGFLGPADVPVHREEVCRAIGAHRGRRLEKSLRGTSCSLAAT